MLRTSKYFVHTKLYMIMKDSSTAGRRHLQVGVKAAARPLTISAAHLDENQTRTPMHGTQIALSRTTGNLPSVRGIFRLLCWSEQNGGVD